MLNWLRYLVSAALIACGTGGLAQTFVIAPQFEAAGVFDGTIAPVKKDGLWGVIDTNGRWLVAPRFQGIKTLEGDNFAGLLGQEWRLYNRNGDLRNQFVFDDIVELGDWLFAIKRGSHWAVIQGIYEEAEPEFLFEEIGGGDGRFVTARDAGGWALFEFKGNLLTRHRLPKKTGSGVVTLNKLYAPHDGGFIAQTDNGEVLYEVGTIQNQVIAQPEGSSEPAWVGIEMPLITLKKEARSFKRFSEGMAGISLRPGAWGFYHAATGKVRWGDRFENVREFSSGFAPVKTDGKWGYIDRRGRVVVPAIYDNAYPFRNGIAVVRQGDLRGFLHASESAGLQVLFEPQFEDVYRFSNGLAPAKTGGKWGYIHSGLLEPNLWVGEVTVIAPPE